MTAGSTISHYRIVEKLGEGGMGVVYKAEDTALERPVALKFLANHLLNDVEAKERFLREAKAAAALHHPNVCPVYEIAEADGKTFLAMAFLKGETLEDRIAKGPLPLKDALDIARQVAEGLQAAHAEGIVHRDIKPANILISPEGRATIMDFGLARLTEASKLTRADQTVGTAAYMSPEQIQGAEVDHRTDIWALGCVLYEMVAGVRPFKGQYDQALAYEIVNQEAEPLTAVRAGVPMELEFIVGKCLAKEADSRYQHAVDLAVDLRILQEKLRSGRSTILRTIARTPHSSAGPAGQSSTLQPEAVAVPNWRRSLPWALFGLSALAALALAFIHFRETLPERPVRRLAVMMPAQLPAESDIGHISISPNGRYIAYATTDGSLWVQGLDQLEPKQIEGVSQASRPFWSRDSELLGFRDGGQLYKMSLRQGIATSVCRLTGPFTGGAWSSDGATIVFTIQNDGIFSVAARGGTPEKIFDHPHAESPSFLPTPDGRAALLFAAAPGEGRGHEIRVLVLGTDEARVLTSTPFPQPEPFYSPSGHIVFVGETNDSPYIEALPFSVASLEVEGDGFPIAGPGISPSVSDDGTLLYVAAGDANDAIGQMVWRDRRGAKLATIGQPQPGLSAPALSPDGRRVAVVSKESGSLDIWVQDLVRSTNTRLTVDEGSERTPSWSPSGAEIIYSLTLSVRRLVKQAADGTGGAVFLTEAVNLANNPDWARDGRYLVYDTNIGMSSDILYLQFETGGAISAPHPFLSTPANEAAPKFSPDGRFLVYVSNESGRAEVYVRPFPDGAGKWQVSVNGGNQPRWSRNGKELYYVEGEALMAVPVSTAQGVILGQPQKLFESADLRSRYPTPTYEVSDDGQKFLTITPVEKDQRGRTEPSKIRVVENWYEEFRDREGQ